MIYVVETYGFILSTTREIAGNGDFRLSPQPDGTLAYGYDGYEGDGIEGTAWMLSGENAHLVPADEKPSPYTEDERREIADYMIQAWERWARTGTP